MSETDCQSPSSSPSSPPPAPTEGNGQAIASMVLGIVSFVLCGPLCSVPAVILGHMTLEKVRRGVVSQDARSFAMAGTILGWINIALVTLGILFMALAIGLGYWSGGAGCVSPFVYQL